MILDPVRSLFLTKQTTNEAITIFILLILCLAVRKNFILKFFRQGLLTGLTIGFNLV